MTASEVGGYLLFFFQAEDGIRDLVRSRGLGDVYKRQVYSQPGVGDDHRVRIVARDRRRRGDEILMPRVNLVEHSISLASNGFPSPPTGSDLTSREADPVRGSSANLLTVTQPSLDS